MHDLSVREARSNWFTRRLAQAECDGARGDTLDEVVPVHRCMLTGGPELRSAAQYREGSMAPPTIV